MRWGTPERLANHLQHAIKIVDHVAVPEPDDPIATGCQLGAAPIVGCGTLGMLAAVEFDRELGRRAGKVCDPISDWVLPAEFPGSEALAQGTP